MPAETPGIADTPQPVAPPGPGEVRMLVVAGRSVAVWNVGGVLYALEDVCPHRGWVLSEGHLERQRGGAVAVVCPGHGWRFDLGSGSCTHAPERLATFGVEVDGDRMWVGPEARPAQDSAGTG